MSRDRSLDEFARSAPSESADDDGEADDEKAEVEPDSDAVEVTDSPAADEEADDVAPAVSTYAFSPDGAPCDSCGAVVQKRWRDDAGLVCPDCKQW